jgi:hypothetical protein
MTKRVVFAGGVQVKALAKAYRLDVALDYDEDVYFIGADSIAREAAQKVVAAADILVTDLTTDGPTVPNGLVRVGTYHIAVPVVTADFIWPYAGGAHPRNGPVAGLPDGPYPSGFGDTYLDSLAAEGLDEDAAVQRYLALDVAQDAGLDARLNATLEGLRALDAQTGFDLADFVSANFRTQWLFATRDRMNMPLFKHVAGRLFGQMGVGVSRIVQLTETFFPVGTMPIHPAVLAHFGMQTPSAEYRYPMLDEGFFSFGQYCRRYWTYDFNRLLHSAIAKAATHPSEAIPELRLALERSPESRSGLRALKDAERSVSDETMLPPLSLAPPDPISAPAPVMPATPPARLAKTLVAAPRLAETEPAAPARVRPVEAVAEAAPAAPSMALTLTPAQPEGDAGEAVEGSTSVRLPPELRRQPSGLVPRAAFGSSLVRAPVRTIDAELDSEESTVSLRFTSFPIPEDAPARETGGMLVPLTEFTEPADGAAALDQSLQDELAEPEPQQYVELPLGEIGDPPALLPGGPALRGDRYKPLAPAEHLIPVLPRMLPNTRGMAGAVDKAFVDMPEIMPPPPLRPVLPPELHPEPVKTSFMAKLMDQLRK